MLSYERMRGLLKSNGKQQLEESNKIVRQLIQHSELGVMDLLALIPKSFLANHLHPMIEAFLKANETDISVVYLVEFLIEGLYTETGDKEVKQAFIKNITRQQALDLFMGCLFRISRLMKLTTLLPLEKLIKQFKPKSQQLLPLYFKIEAVRKDKRESEYWNGHLEQLSKSLVARGVDAVGLEGYKQLLVRSIRSAIKSTVYAFIGKNCDQYVEKLNQLFLKNNKVQNVLSNFFSFDGSESSLVNMLGQCMYHIATSKKSTSCQQQILFFLVLYIEASKHKLSKYYEKIRLLMIKRLFTEGMTRWNCEHSLALLIHRATLSYTIDHLGEFTELQEILSQTIFSIYSILIERENRTQLQELILKECKKQAIQLIKEPIINNQMFLKRDWHDKELQQHLASRFSKGKYINDLDTALEHVKSLLSLLIDACQSYRLQRVYLCLLHLRDYLIPLSREIEPFSYQILSAIDKSLTCLSNYYRRLQSSYRTTQLTIAIQLLCSWHIAHCNVRQHIDCIQTKCSLTEVYEFRHSVSNSDKNAKKVRKFINDKRYFFGISEIYNSQKLIEANDQSQSTNIPSAVYPQREDFVLRQWVINICIVYKLRKDVTRFFETVSLVSLEESICNLLLPLLIHHICSQEKFNEVYLQQQILNLFNKWIFAKRTPIEYRNGFLNLPQVLGVWKNQSGTYKGPSPDGVIKSIYNQLDQYKLSRQYADAKNYKGAIRCLQTHLNKHPQDVNSTTLQELYCYEAQLNYEMRQISFKTIIDELKVDLKKENPNLHMLLDRDKIYFNRIRTRFDLWMAAINKNKPAKVIQYEKEIEELCISVCKEIVVMQTWKQKQSLYTLLKMISHLHKILKICLDQKLQTDKINIQASKQCRLRRAQYNKLLEFTHLSPPLGQLIHNLVTVLELDLVDEFKCVIFQTLYAAVPDFQKWFECKDKPELLRVIVQKMQVQYYFDNQKFDQLQSILNKQDKLDFIMLAYERKEYLIALQESESMIKSYAKKQLEGRYGWMELFYYFFSCKKKVTWTQMDIKRPLQQVKQITYHKSQVKYLLLLLNLLYIDYKIDRYEMEIILKIATNWLIFSLQDNIPEESQRILFVMLKLLLDKVDDHDLPIFSGNILKLIQQKPSLISSDVIEMLINRIQVQSERSSDFISELLFKAAQYKPNESLFWLMRLIHYCDICFEDNPKINVQSLITENDRLKEKIGIMIFKAVGASIDKEAIAFTHYLYGVFKMKKQVKASSSGKKLAEGQKKTKWVLYQDVKPQITKEVSVPFTRQLRVTKVLGSKNIDANSKCMTKLIEVNAIEGSQKDKNFKAQFILKAEFKPNNKGHEQRASRLFRCVIPPQLKITYTILQLSKYFVMVEYMDGYETVRKIITKFNNTKEDHSVKNSRIYSQINRDQPFQIVYIKHIDNIHPVLQILLQRKSTLDEWWIARINYIQTTAVWSMLGYIFGLGDRHCGNIMINPDSCKVLHIDYEYFMDAGKNLPFPQYVPFRMTKNIEAPMGLFGAFGLFYIYSVKFVRSLQKKWDTIIDCIDQFRIDQSKVTFIKEVLERLNFTRYSSIEEGVLKIIRDSKNHQLLSKMFHGWNALQ